MKYLITQENQTIYTTRNINSLISCKELTTNEFIATLAFHKRVLHFPNRIDYIIYPTISNNEAM